MIPLIGLRSIHQYTSINYKHYIKSLRETYIAEREQKKLERAGKPKTPIKGISFRYNERGTPILIIRDRKPKWLSPDEINTIARFYGVPQNIMWQVVKNRKIEISSTKVQIKLGEITW